MDTKLLNKIKNSNFELILNKKNYSFFNNGDYNLNIIGIRNLENGNIQDNTFNDFICIIYKINNKWFKDIYEITTDPGIKSLKEFDNEKGCAILVPYQYKGCWKIGLHKGKYKALVQNKPILVYRDNNKDNKLDFNINSIDSGIFGINIHHAGSNSNLVDNWSAGCQVFKKINDFNKFINLCDIAKSKYGNSFTYTLITSNDL